MYSSNSLLNWHVRILGSILWRVFTTESTSYITPLPNLLMDCHDIILLEELIGSVKVSDGTYHVSINLSLTHMNPLSVYTLQSVSMETAV